MTLLTPFLNLPLLAPSQAQKTVIHNEALQHLDALVHLVVKDICDTPPTAPNGNERFIIGATPTGPWEGKSGEIAAYIDNAWVYFKPVNGWICWNISGQKLFVFNGTAWEAVTLPLNSPIPYLGVNAMADNLNKLTVKSPNSLFDHEAGSHRLKVNRSDTSETASVLLQTDYAGQVEFGLIGDSFARLKVSADSTQWYEGFNIDGNSGQISFPNTLMTNVKVVLLSSGSGTYTVPGGVLALKVQIVGGGGGGAGAETLANNVFVGAGGGGSAAFACRTIPNDQLELSYNYQVGSGGQGGAAQSGDPVGSRSGADGTDSTFTGENVAIVAGGGKGALEDTPSASNNEFKGGDGGLASGGDINILGSQGCGGLTAMHTYYYIGSGKGASGPLGQGGVFANGNGGAGTGYGAGGAGCGMIPGYVLNRTGGDGAPGCIILTEYY